MKVLRHCFLGFLALTVVGCASCVPGVCGCALSIWPSNIEDALGPSALVADIVGFAGMVVCAIIMMVMWVRRKAIEDSARIRREQQERREA